MASPNSGIDDAEVSATEKGAITIPSSVPTAELLGEEARAIDPDIERRVLRKIDMFLMPAMVFGYGLVYYDKVRRTSNCSASY